MSQGKGSKQKKHWAIPLCQAKGSMSYVIEVCFVNASRIECLIPRSVGFALCC